MAKDILQIIVENKKEEVRQARKKLPEDEIRQKALAFPRSKRPFVQTLCHPGPDTINIIAEIKRASPSKGDISPNLDPFQLAGRYEEGGAAALSVLTDRKFFKGSFEDFREARKGSSLPMLRKDFLIDSYQLYESVLLAADAILLIARILSAEQLQTLLLLARELGLDVLMEIHNQTDLKKAINAGADLIGINNRNLRSFDTDIQVAMRLVSGLQPNQTPVAASGISSRADIDQSLTVGIHNFLIGESLVRADDTVAFLRSLTGQP